MRQRRIGHRAGVAAIISAMLGAGVVTAVLAGSGGSTAPPSAVAVVRTVVTTAASAAAGTGDGDARRMPDVVGRPLDQARTAVVAAGGSVAVSGGGLFGIIDESAWTVCSTEPGSGSGLGSRQRVVLHVDRSCE